MSDYRRKFDVDILVRGWNNLNLTRDCLHSIKANTDPARYLVTYVDNGSDRLELNQLIQEFQGDNFQFVILPFNHGSVRAINIGLALAIMSDSSYVLLLDNDTAIPTGNKGWLDNWLTYFEDETVGAAGAVSNYTSGYQNAEARIDLYQKEWEIEGEGRGIKDPPDMPILVSFGLMLRKSIIAQVGLFDEQFEPGMSEDYDWIIRMHEKGYAAVVANSVWIHHRGSQTFTGMGFNNLLETSYRRLKAKHGIEKLEGMGIKIA